MILFEKRSSPFWWIPFLGVIGRLCVNGQQTDNGKYETYISAERQTIKGGIKVVKRRKIVVFHEKSFGFLSVFSNLQTGKLMI